MNIYVYRFDEWTRADVRLASPGPFSDRFRQATTRAVMIHFNLYGIDDPKDYAERFGNNGQFSADPRSFFTASRERAEGAKNP